MVSLLQGQLLYPRVPSAPWNALCPWAQAGPHPRRSCLQGAAESCARVICSVGVTLGRRAEKGCPAESVVPSNAPCHGACFPASSRQGAVITPPSAQPGQLPRCGRACLSHLLARSSVLGPRTQWPALQAPSEPWWTGSNLTLTPALARTAPSAPTRTHTVSCLTHGPLAQHRCGVLCLGTRNSKFQLTTSLTADEQVGFERRADKNRKPNVSPEFSSHRAFP